VELENPTSFANRAYEKEMEVRERTTREKCYNIHCRTEKVSRMLFTRLLIKFDGPEGFSCRFLL
jgi:hypothetical protein